MDDKLMQLHKDFDKHTAAVYLGRERADGGYWIWMCSCGAFFCRCSGGTLEWVDGLAAEEFCHDLEPLIRRQTPEIQAAWAAYIKLARKAGVATGQGWLGKPPKDARP